MADVVLFYPKTGFDIGAGITPPHSILSIAAEIKEDYEVKIIDQRTNPSWKAVLRNEFKKNPLCIGISSMTGMQIKFALEASRFVRENSSTKIVWGGVHATLLPEQTLKNENIDIVVRGEGEQTFKEMIPVLEKGGNLGKIRGLTYKKKGRTINNEDRPFLDMNTLKETPWDLVNVKSYMHRNVVRKGSRGELDIGETSRGCPFRCGFCYNTVFNKGCWRSLSIENTIKKIKSSVERFDLDVIWLRDDNFFVNIERARKVVEALNKEKVNILWYTSGIRTDIFERMSDRDIIELKKSGCEGFRFGIESGNQRILNLVEKNITTEQVYKVNKRCKRLNVVPHYSFMAGLPTETVKEVIDTVRMMKRLKRENRKAVIHVINMYTPYPGTNLFDLAVKNGLDVPGSLEEWSRYHHLSNFASHLSRKDRKTVTNIADISYLISDAMGEALPKTMQMIMNPFRLWLKVRWELEMFGFAPELSIFRFIRNSVMKNSM
jgi:anaerobic magnesium-protoporphyrin IX monomethyl ester cyclase